MGMDLFSSKEFLELNPTDQHTVARNHFKETLATSKDYAALDQNDRNTVYHNYLSEALPAPKKGIVDTVIGAVDEFAKDPIGNIIGKREHHEAPQTHKAKSQPSPVSKVQEEKPHGTTPWDNLMVAKPIDTRFVTSDPKQVKAAIDADNKAKQAKNDKLNKLLGDAPAEDATLETVFSMAGGVKAGVGLVGALSKSKEIAAEGAKSFAKGNAFAAGDMAGQAGAEVGMEAADAVMTDDFKKNHEMAAGLIKAGAGLVLGGVAGWKAEANRLNQMQYQAAQDIIDSSAQHLGVEVPKAQPQEAPMVTPETAAKDDAIATAINKEHAPAATETTGEVFDPQTDIGFTREAPKAENPPADSLPPPPAPSGEKVKIEEPTAHTANPNGEQMFLEENPFKEIERDPDYFFKNKEGLKTKVVRMAPEDYIQAVEDRQPLHKEHGPEQDKLDALKVKYESGTKVDMPMLGYGARDHMSDDFSQEGYHRAVTAMSAGKKDMPVALRYRDNDANMPDYIKKYVQEEELAPNSILEVAQDHPRYNELLDMRRKVSAKDARSPNTREQGRQFVGDPVNPQVVGAIDTHNYNYDFELTQGDVNRIERGKITPEIEAKLQRDLERLDNDPTWAKVDENPRADYPTDKEGNPLDVNGNQIFARGGDNLFAGTVAGMEEDENGNLSFNPEKFVLGMGGYTAVKALAKNPSVQKAVRARAQYAMDAMDFTPQVMKRNGINGMLKGDDATHYNDIASIHNIDTTAADPALVQRAAQGSAQAKEDLARAVYSRTFETIVNKNTAEQLKPMVLTKLIQNPEMVDDLAAQLGYNFRFFSSNPDNIGRAIGDKVVEAQPLGTTLQKEGYAKGNVFVYDPYDTHGSFNDAQYTKAWRGIHELSHAITEKIMQSRYGDSKRFGAMSFPSINHYDLADKKIYKPLTLEQAQRAVEWEDVAFRTQLKLLDELGIKVNVNQAINDFNIAGTDTILRTMTGDFSDAATLGVIPRTDNARIDVKDVLKLLENQEIANAAHQGRRATLGVNVKTWTPISDEELSAVLADAKEMKLNTNLNEEQGLQFSIESVAGIDVDPKMKELIQGLPADLQVAYHRDMMASLSTNSGENIIARKLGLETSQNNILAGSFKGEANPSTQLQIKPQYDQDGKLTEDFKDRIDDFAEIMAMALKQDGVGWHYPEFIGGDDMAKVNGIEVNFGHPLKAPQVQQLEVLLSSDKMLKGKFFIASTEDGLRVINADSDILLNEKFVEIVERQLSKLNGDLEGHITYFNSLNGYQGGLDENLVKKNSSSRRPDLQKWIDNIVTQRVERVNERYTRIAWENALTGPSGAYPKPKPSSLYSRQNPLTDRKGTILPYKPAPEPFEVPAANVQEGYYSKLQNALNELTNRNNPITTLSPHNLRAFLKKKGISSDEMQWSGLNEQIKGQKSINLNEIELEYPQLESRSGNFADAGGMTERQIEEQLEQEVKDWDGTDEYYRYVDDEMDYFYNEIDRDFDSIHYEKIDARAKELAEEAEGNDAQWGLYRDDAIEELREGELEREYTEITDEYRDMAHDRAMDQKREELQEQYANHGWGDEDSDELGRRWAAHSLSDGGNNYGEHITAYEHPRWHNVNTNLVGGHWDGEGEVLYHSRTEDLGELNYMPQDSAIGASRQAFNDYENMLIKKYGSEQGVRDNITDAEKAHYLDLNGKRHAAVSTVNKEKGKTLFVQETQSDHHQAGRSDGYASDFDPKKMEQLQAKFDAVGEKKVALQKEYDDLYVSMFDVFTKRGVGRATLEAAVKMAKNSEELLKHEIGRKEILPNYDVKLQTFALDLKQNHPDEISRMHDIQAEARLLQAEERTISSAMDKLEGGIEDAPYKTTYHEKSIKDMIAKAIDGDYESIAFNSSDLKNGGFQSAPSQGMKSMYDEKMPSFTLKYLKQFDPSIEMREAYIPNTKHKVYVYPITDKLKEGIKERGGQPLYVQGGGAIAGVGEDEDGNLTFDPLMALAGAAGTSAMMSKTVRNALSKVAGKAESLSDSGIRNLTIATIKAADVVTAGSITKLSKAISNSSLVDYVVGHKIYKLKDYMKMREDALRSSNAGMEQAARLHLQLNELSSEAREAMYDYMTGDKTVALSPALKQAADTFIAQVDEMGQKAVDDGFLSKEAYEEWKGQYLHRRYASKMKRASDFASGKGEFGIDKIQMRGKQWDATEDEYFALEQAGVIGKISEGKIEAVPKADGGYKLRRDWTKQERTEMGEIRDVAYSLPETMGRLSQMIEFGNMLKNIPSKYLLKQEGRSDKVMVGLGYEKLTGSRYGALNGQWVNSSIASDIKRVSNDVLGEEANVKRLYNNYVTAMKMSHTVYNPTAHVNNVGSNVFLQAAAGLNPAKTIAYAADGANAARKFGRYKELDAKRVGGLSTDEAQELAKLEADESVTLWKDLSDHRMFGRSRLNEMLRTYMSPHIDTTSGSALHKTAESAKALYQAEDDIMRYAAVKQLMQDGLWTETKTGIVEQKMTLQEAMKHVNDHIIPDYSKPMSKLALTLRDSGLVPFMSWTYYSTPILMSQLKNHPTRVLAIAGAWYGIDRMFGVDPYDTESMPKGFDAQRMAVARDGDKVTGMRISSMVPHIQLAQPENTFIEPLTSGVPQGAIGALTNYNFYFRKPITQKKGPEGTYQRFTSAWQNVLPSPDVVDKLYNIGESHLLDKETRRKDRVIEPRTPAQEAASLFINLQTYDESQQRSAARKEKISTRKYEQKWGRKIDKAFNKLERIFQ